MKILLNEVATELNKTPKEILEIAKTLNISSIDSFTPDEALKITNFIHSPQNNKTIKKTRATGLRVVKKRKELKENPIDTKNFKHFIECEISPDICPILWEELTPTDNKNKRYCKYCKREILKVDDKETLEKYQNTTQCLAISEKLLEEMNLTTNENLEKRLLFSKLFLVFKHNHPKYWNKIKFLDKEEQIIKMIEFIETNNKTELYQKNNVDLEEIQKILATK